MAAEKDRIRFRRMVEGAGFVQISNLVLVDTSLSDGAYRTYGVLTMHARQADSCFPGLDTLARERGVTRRALQRHITELRVRGFITVERRGLNLTNVYWLEDLEPVYRQSTPDVTKLSTPDVTETSDQDAQNSSHPLDAKNIHKQESETLNVPRPQLHDSVFPDVRRVIELTGDSKSQKRFAQLFAIAQNSNTLHLWDLAISATTKRMARDDEPLRRPGAYFSQCLAAMLLEAGVSVPVGTKADREEVRAALAAAPFMRGAEDGGQS